MQQPSAHMQAPAAATGTVAQLRHLYGNDETKLRTLDMLQLLLRNRREERLLDALPVFGGKIIDLVELYLVVIRHGGYELVTAQGMWPAISRLLGLPANEATEQRIMQTYRQLLQNFEDYIRLAQGLPTSSLFTPRTPTQMAGLGTPLQAPQVAQQLLHQHQPPRQMQQPTMSSQPPDKRKRTSMPTSAASTIHPLKSLQAEVEVAISLLGSGDWNDRTKAVNALLRLSVEHEKDMLFDNFPGLLAAITTAMDDALPVARMAFDQQVSSHVRASMSFSSLSWDVDIGAAPVVDHLLRQLPANKLEVALLSLVRNMSIDPVNEMHIAHSATIMRHLCVCIVNPTTDASSCAFDILAQVCRYIDVTGRKRAENDLWLEDTSSQNKSALKLNLNADLAGTTTAEYVAAVWGVFAGALRALFREEKEVILRALDLLIRLAHIAENKSAFLKCPQELLERVVELMCVTYSSCDPMAVYESEGNMGARRGHGVYLPPAVAGDYEDRVDTDVRDLAIEFFVQLCNLSPDIQSSFMAIPETLSIVRQLVQTKVGRPDVPRIVGTLVNQLTPIAGLHPLLALTQLDLVKAACEGSDIAADLSCGSLREIFAMPAWTEATTLHSSVPGSVYADTPSLQGSI